MSGLAHLSQPRFFLGKAALCRYLMMLFQRHLRCCSKILPLNLTGIGLPLRIEDSR